MGRAWLVWMPFRILSYGIVLTNIVSLGTFLYIIAPYTTFFFFNDLRFWKYLKYFHRYYFQSLAYFRFLYHKDRSVFWGHLPLTSPPMEAADYSRVRLSSTWTLPADTCGDCSACCELLSTCCFYEASQRRCLCYGSLFWKFFNCGRFPTSQQQVTYFKCPKFTFNDNA